jgi:hypothetical protein
MTKLVIVLAVVVVVILVVVFVAVRNMRAEDPEEFVDRPPRRGGNRGSRDDRDLRYDRQEPAERQPAGVSRGSRPAGRAADGAYRPAAGATRGSDERRDYRDDGYDQGGPGGRGYAEDSDVAPRRTNGDRRSATRPGRPEERRRAAKGRPGEESARSRSARSRLSGDSSEWDSSEWEKLSDIDYWTELASDKPLTTTAQPAAQDRPGRPRADREAETAAIRTRPAAEAGPADVSLGEADTGPAGTIPRAVPRRDPVTGLPVTGRPQPANAELAVAADRQAELAPAPVPATDGQLRPPADPRPPQPRHVGPAGAPARGVAPDRRPTDPDDDPLTSPSFPRVPASDSRTYHNGPTSTPSRGSRVPAEQLAPTQEFRSYGSPAPQHAAARHAVPADFGGDTDRTDPNSYLPDPLLNGDPYAAPNGSTYPAPNGSRYPAPNADPYPAPNGGTYAAPNGNPYPLPPAPAPASAASGNPYGSYVTSDGQDTAVSYGDYPAPDHGPGSYLSAPISGSTGRHSGNGHRQSQQPTTASVPGPGTTGYPDGPAPRDRGAHAAGYRNGYGQHERAGYVPGGYPAGSPNPAGYGRQDRYGRDEYGGYPEYGAAEN